MTYQNKSSVEKQRDFNELKEAVRRSVTCESILDSFNYKPQKYENNGIQWYISPFRDEKTASFKLDTNTNAYIDFGEDALKYNDVISLVMRLHEMGNISFDSKFSHLKPFSQAVLYLADISGLNNKNSNYQHKKVELKKPSNTRQYEKKDNIVLKSVEELKTRSLIDYFVNKRLISEDIVKTFLVEVKYSFPKYPNSTFFSVGFKNKSGGYELRSPPTEKNKNGFKGGTSPKDITLIKGKAGTLSVDLWEGFTDMMTLCEMKGTTIPINNTIVMNSTSLVREALEFLIKMKQEKGNLKKVYAYLDNDIAGEKALHMLRYGVQTPKLLEEAKRRGDTVFGLEDIGVTIVSQGEILYPNHKDLNEMYTTIKKNREIASTQSQSETKSHNLGR